MLKELDQKLISIYIKLKSQKDNLFYILFKPLGNLGIPADVISFLGLFLGTISAFFLGSSHLLFFSFWFGYKLADTIDGTFARLNDKKVLKNINVDYLCDNIYSIQLFLASMRIVGITLPLISIITYLLHIIFNQSLKGTSFFVPRSDYAQFLFLINKYDMGLLLQITLTITFLILGKIVYKKRIYSLS